MAARAIIGAGRLLAITAAALATACGGEERGLAAGRNLLVITVDTTRADHISCLGGDPRNTPSIDALAARSTLFTNAASEANVTNPSHVTILSGQRILQHGVVSNLVPMPADLDTLPTALSRRGYQTAAVVATQFLRDVPRWRGFDDFPEVKDVLRAGQVSGRAMRWLEQRDPARPFFLWVHYYDPHAFYVPPPADAQAFYQGDPTAGDELPIGMLPYFEDAEPETLRWLLGVHGPIRDRAWPRAMYQAEIHAMDRQIGRLLARLAELDLQEQTVVVLAADHGESLGEHGIYYDHKGLFEQQLRIPLVIHVPGLAPRRSDALVSTLDIVPTLEELMGFRTLAPKAGLSLVGELGGEPRDALQERATFVHQSAHNSVVALREGDWKLIWPVAREQGHLPTEPLLFDLSADPGEERDLLAREPQRVEAMKRWLQPWIDLGEVQKGSTADISPEVLDSLRQLGYADHTGG